MASAIEMFRQAAVLQNLLPNTRKDYANELRAFHEFTGKPASQWTSADVRQWMIALHDDEYSSSARKKSLCAVKFFFVHVLKSELGVLDLPPMPVVRQTLRHAFVTYGLRCGNDLPTMMDLVGHEDANTTMIYAHGDAARGVSPLDVAAQPVLAASIQGLLS
jgi:site-specific recombinase XerD